MKHGKNVRDSLSDRRHAFIGCLSASITLDLRSSLLSPINDSMEIGRKLKSTSLSSTSDSEGWTRSLPRFGGLSFKLAEHPIIISSCGLALTRPSVLFLLPDEYPPLGVRQRINVQGQLRITPVRSLSPMGIRRFSGTLLATISRKTKSGRIYRLAGTGELLGETISWASSQLGQFELRTQSRTPFDVSASSTLPGYQTKVAALIGELSGSSFGMNFRTSSYPFTSKRVCSSSRKKPQVQMNLFN